MFFKAADLLKTLRPKRNILIILLLIISLNSIFLFTGLQVPFIIGFTLLTFFPGYLISCVFFTDRLIRLAFSPAISLVSVILPVILLNNIFSILISKTNVIIITSAAFLFSAFVWFRYSKPSKKAIVPKRLIIIILLSVLAIGIPAALNGSLGEEGIRYGGNFDNDPWMHQAYANRILIEQDIPVHDPFVSNIEETRFYHYGFHTYLAVFSLLTDLRIFQILQIFAIFTPVWFALTAYVFLRKFLREKTSLLVVFLFIFAAGFGGILFIIQGIYIASQHGILSLPDLLASDPGLRKPFGLSPFDLLNFSNLPFGIFIIPQASGFVISLTVFPILYFLVKRRGFDLKTRFLIGSLIAFSFISHFILSVILFAIFFLYLIFETIFIGKSRKSITDLMDIFLVFLLLYIPYYIHSNILTSSSIPGIGFSIPFHLSLLPQTTLGFGLAFIFGFPFLFYLLRERTHLHLFLFSSLMVILLLVSMAIPISPGVFRNYAVRLMFIPIFISLGIFLERTNVISKKNILITLLLILSTSTIINSVAYTYAVVSDKDTISFEEWEALEWIRSNTDTESVFLSSEYEVGPFSKIPVFTGRKAFIGGTYVIYFGDTPEFRMAIDAIYNSTDIQAAYPILKKYSIDYVYIGPNERKLYPQDSLDKFLELESVFSNKEIIILRYNTT